MLTLLSEFNKIGGAEGVMECLNPCFPGYYSQSYHENTFFRIY